MCYLLLLACHLATNPLFFFAGLRQRSPGEPGGEGEGVEGGAEEGPGAGEPAELREPPAQPHCQLLRSAAESGEQDPEAGEDPAEDAAVPVHAQDDPGGGEEMMP